MCIRDRLSRNQILRPETKTPGTINDNIVVITTIIVISDKEIINVMP